MLDVSPVDFTQIGSQARDLASLSLNERNLDGWLTDWSRWAALVYEVYQRLYVATTVNTADAAAQERYDHFVSEVYPQTQADDQKIKQRLLESGLQPAGFEIPLRNLRAEADLFREANLPLLSEDLKYWIEYDQIIGAQTVIWEGQETPVAQLQTVYQNTDRALRQRAWELAAQRQLADREAINALWVKYMNLRRQIAANAGKPNYREYRWQQQLRFDYTPADCYRFHQAIEEVIVPRVLRNHERRRSQLAVETLRPWDLNVDPLGREPLRPFADPAELEAKVSAMFHRVDGQLGNFFAIMRRENMLDLANRKNKAPGAYCTDFPITRRPFIFMNAVGLHEDVQTLLHEGGHAFHVFESAVLPYFHQLQVPMEFAEVASMTMELLAAPYLDEFYTPQEVQRARSEHLTDNLRFWPYMAVVDAFQQWVYENSEAACDPANCDATWLRLWRRLMPGVDWSGYEEIVATGWQRKQHILQTPFYYIEYGLAQLGAMQIWRNALQDQAGAVAAYRKALALGGSVTLPQLYAAAGAKFTFDAGTLNEAAVLIDQVLGV